MDIQCHGIWVEVGRGDEFGGMGTNPSRISGYIYTDPNSWYFIAESGFLFLVIESHGFYTEDVF